MTCRFCVQLPLDLDGVDDSINTQILKTPHILLSHLWALDNGRNSYIGKLRKREEIYFHTAALKALNKNTYVIAMTSYPKW